MLDLSAIILTYNEEIHISRAIRCLSSFAKQVYVVDSYSTDCTCEIAQDLGAIVFQNPFVNQSQQFQWAMNSLPIDTEWLLRLDADEILQNDLIARLQEVLPTLDSSVNGLALNRQHIFLNKWIAHGGRYPLWMLRVWRRGFAAMESRWMDEHLVVTSGRVIKVNGGFVDHNLHDISYFIDKHNKYATREAVEYLGVKHGIFCRHKEVTSATTTQQAALKRWIKESFYNRIPFFVSAPLYFLFRYFFQLGFLDGVPGLVYHFLQGFWYRFLVGVKVYELSQLARDAKHPDELKLILSQKTGLRLDEGSGNSPQQSSP